ncbi:MAG: deoxyribose-phosphate aldolase [Tannerellaceae bacterium]|jgi:deoxyribose-phosphate aldolase|nr:deoxyribose-phosphate aldolase [Tannerellaceae bacterium]
MNTSNKYQEAFGKFESIGTDHEVTEKVSEILKEEAKQNFTPEVLKFIHGCIDLTSLSALDTKESIWKMVDSVNDFEGSRPDIPNVAAICTYPLFTETVKQALTAQDVKIAAVTGGFPASQTFQEIKIAETALAVMSGADEIDTVLNLGYLAEENYADLAEEIQEIKESARGGKLKVILETGAISTVDSISKATIISIYAGADFIKTSTGKEFPGATPEAVYTICRIIKQYYSITGIKTGIKISGGIRKAEDAINYYSIVKHILGDQWLSKDYFRIGASSLAGDIIRHIGE